MRVEKQEFKNQTGGWLGVVVIGPKGDDRGASVEAGGSVWLSEEEQVLTANAPRRPEDNPFVEQTFESVDPNTGDRSTLKLVPLVPVNSGRYVPADLRPIGGTLSDAESAHHAQVAATGSGPVQPVQGDPLAERIEQVRDQGDNAQPGNRDTPPAQASARARAAAEAAAGAGESPEADAGPEEPPSAPVEPPTPEPTPEETAVQQPPVEEETGAAPQPSGEAVAGSFSPGEEVGTPVQAQADENAAASESGPPAPFVPPNEG